MKSPLKPALTGAPGHSTETRRQALIDDGISKYLIVPVALWLVTVVEALGALRNAPRAPLLFATIALAATAYGAWGLIRLRRRAGNFKLGRDGEREVAQILARLDIPGARVFHDVPADGFNLDHVVICERGIFVIETKTWRKPLRGNTKLRTHNGQLYKGDFPAPGEPVAQAMAEAQWFSDLLRAKTGRGYRCQPVLAFPGWFVEPMDNATKAKAWVLHPDALLAFIDHERPRLAPQDVHMAVAAVMQHLGERAGP